MNADAIVTDVDGTLTDKDKIIDLTLLESLRTVNRKGIKVIFATGNVMPVIYGLYIYLGIDGGIVAENGGLLFYNNQLEVTGRRDDIDRILAEQGDRNRYRYLFTDRWRVSEVALTMDSDLEHIENLFSSPEYTVEVSGFAIHIMHSSMSKSKGVLESLKRMDIDPERVIAFGDGDNDAEMLSAVGTGIAVANGSEKARKSARMVTSRPHGEGVLEALKKLNLI